MRQSRRVAKRFGYRLNTGANDPLFRGVSRVRNSILILAVLLLMAGCDAPIERFPTNDVYALTLAHSRQTPAAEITAGIPATVTELFGTPDAPRWPDDLATLLPSISPSRLARAAGPVSSRKDGTHVGLFREHCVVCHGLAGSGTGPACQVQNPYPRDFRHGVFKWKSTQRAAKPNRDDLRSLLGRGIPGTAMPSFALIAAEDIEALVDYITYLSIRGEVERRLMTAAVDDPDYLAGPDGARDAVRYVGESWQHPTAVPVPTPPESTAAAIERGKAIFHGSVANCVGCHGPGGNGEAITVDYDDWTKEYSTRIGLTPTDREAMRPFRAAGGLRPRQTRPRDLRQGVFRGGGDGPALYQRITQGIAGTPMPGVAVVDQANGTGLTASQVWDLVHYVQSLGPGSQP